MTATYYLFDLFEATTCDSIGHDLVKQFMIGAITQGLRYMSPFFLGELKHHLEKGNTKRVVIHIIMFV